MSDKLKDAFEDARTRIKGMNPDNAEATIAALKDYEALIMEFKEAAAKKDFKTIVALKDKIDAFKDKHKGFLKTP